MERSTVRVESKCTTKQTQAEVRAFEMEERAKQLTNKSANNHATTEMTKAQQKTKRQSKPQQRGKRGRAIHFLPRDAKTCPPSVLVSIVVVLCRFSVPKRID